MQCDQSRFKWETKIETMAQETQKCIFVNDYMEGILGNEIPF